MVDKRLPRIKVICPNGHEVITRKYSKIQCRKCVSQGHEGRFGVKKPEDNDPQQLNNKITIPLNNDNNKSV